MTKEELKIQIALGTAPPISLRDISGKYILDAVDFSVLESGSDYRPDANTIRFRLDDIVYIATEDAEDGYRSCLGEIERSCCEITNTFPAIEVIARQIKSEYDDSIDIVELIDIVNDKIVLRVGTDYSDSYYPVFVNEFSPENMSTNTNLN